MNESKLPGWVERKAGRWNALLQGERPGFLFQVRCESFAGDASMNARPPLWPEKTAERLDWIWLRYMSRMELSERIGDDSIPHLDMLTGTEIFAEAFGCRVERPSHTNPFAMPLINSAEEVAKLKVPKLGSCSLDAIFEMADKLYAKSSGQALFRLADIQSPMDIANLIWSKESLLMALYESPEAVKELAAKVAELLTAFLDEWFSRYGRSFIAHFPDYYMERGITLSVDEVGIVSPEIFEEFFLPELSMLSKRYDGIGIHCCADSRHQWGMFKKVPGLKLLNLVKPPSRGTEFIRDALKEFNGTCAQYHYGWTPEGPFESWPGQYPAGSKIVMDVDAKSLEEAVDLAAKLRQALPASI